MIKLLLLREVNATPFKCLAAFAQTMQRQMSEDWVKSAERTEHHFRCSLVEMVLKWSALWPFSRVLLFSNMASGKNEKTLGTRLVCPLTRHCRHVVSQIPEAHTWVSLRNRNLIRVYIIMDILVTVINLKNRRKLVFYFLPCPFVMQQRFSLVSLRYLWLSLLNLPILKVKNGHLSNGLMREWSWKVPP